MNNIKESGIKIFDTIEVRINDGIAVLSFNRPDQLNAMNRLMMDEIIEALETIIQDSSVLVTIITGNGRAFMAGADIKEYAALSIDKFNSFQHKGTLLYELIENARIPFIAAVNGFALGGGFEIALACDMIVAAESSKLGLPEVHLGLIPGGGGTQRLFQKVGMNRVKEILMLGQSFSARQFYDWGIINIIAADNEFESAVNQLAEKLKRRPSQSLKTIKHLLQPALLEYPFSQRLSKEKAALADLFYSQTAQELIKNFSKK